MFILTIFLQPNQAMIKKLLCSSLALLPLLNSCSSDVCKGNGVATTAQVKLSRPDQPWYQCFTNESGHRMFITAAPVSYQFQHELGYWSAVGANDKKLYMKAAGKNFSIEPGYVWDGATEGPTTNKLLTPTLFHDAMLHAMMNGAPITRDQADGALLQLMRQENFFWSKPYYKIVRNFGANYSQPQFPRTLKIINTPR